MVARQRSVLLSAFFALIASSAAIESLYAEGDNVLELDIDTFNATVYNQKRSFFIEFYSSWCGHCQSYKPTYVKFATSLKSWSPIAQVSVLNCADDKNLPICREHEIDAYPTLAYFKYNSKNKDDGERYKGDKYNVDRLTLDVAKLVHDDWVKQRPTEWPSFDYIDNSATLEDLWNSADPSTLYVALVVENEPAEVGWATLIGFANDKRVRVAISSASHPLAARLSQTGTNGKMHVFKRNSDTPLASSGDSVTWEEIRAKLTDLLDQTSVQQQAPAPVINDGNAAAVVPVDFEQYKVQLVDLKSALGYMVYYEIARKNIIEGDNMAALKGWIHALKKYVPGTVPIRRFFYRLDEWLQIQMSPISSEQWTAKINEIQDSIGHPLPINATWVACRGSKSYLRGYTCGLWTLMHAVTVEAYKQDGQNPQFKPVIDVLEPFHQFIFHYLSCSECAKNFDKLTQNNHLSQVTRAEDVIMWLWRGHNNVNKRLSGAAGDDPSFPKRQFPPQEICHECVDASGNYDEAQVLQFMIRYYADIRSDEMIEKNEYKMSEFEKGKLQKVAIKHLNPKFAAMADKVDHLEEAEQRLRDVDASPQRRWKSLDAQHMGDFERPPSAYGSFFFIWLTIAVLALLVIYAKYRQNRSKFWKTFYYYNDYKLCPWTGPSTSTRKYIA
ncbi:hypothetical protein QR680_019250 [Steinernema hermaphroditum]|uniref:Sulfhydryl oxidase n=1 Tax=Steinernema hermaphroditum TaxID=289476 RepID=A0AA39LS01_9BILA|nr:hypothetical protein QR680_019250 [Steinernema hermaphroditum]